MTAVIYQIITAWARVMTRGVAGPTETGAQSRRPGQGTHRHRQVLRRVRLRRVTQPVAADRYCAVSHCAVSAPCHLSSLPTGTAPCHTAPCLRRVTCRRCRQVLRRVTLRRVCAVSPVVAADRYCAVSHCAVSAPCRLSSLPTGTAPCQQRQAVRCQVRPLPLVCL
jgi:hypothetical protein